MNTIKKDVTLIELLKYIQDNNISDCETEYHGFTNQNLYRLLKFIIGEERQSNDYDISKKLLTNKFSIINPK